MKPFIPNEKFDIASGIFEIEKALDATKFYQVHPEYKPFIGNNFDKYRILQVGESHYIGQKANSKTDEFPITYFDKWWEDSSDKLREWPDPDPKEGKWGGWYNTRGVVENFIANRSTGGYNIFANMIRSFDCVYGNGQVYMDADARQRYHYFAFMNFFQMPSLYEGKKYWDSLLQSAKKLGNEQLAYEMWEKATEVSTNTLNEVINILKPEVVIFTSVSAYDAYHSKHGDDPKIIKATHPCSPWWNRKHGNDNLSGRERLEQRLMAAQSTR